MENFKNTYFYTITLPNDPNKYICKSFEKLSKGIYRLNSNKLVYIHGLVVIDFDNLSKDKIRKIYDSEYFDGENITEKLKIDLSKQVKYNTIDLEEAIDYIKNEKYQDFIDNIIIYDEYK